MTETCVSRIRILLVDDHAMFRQGIARMLDNEPDFEIVGQATSVSGALEQAASSGANLVLLDVDLGTERAVDFVSRVRATGYDGKILIVTAGLSDQEAIQLIKGGVSGILHKHQTVDVLCSAIRQVAAGDVWLEKAYLAPMFRTIDCTRQQGLPSLTERDKAVLRFILQGLTNREMAARLDISEGAVKASLRHVCEKLRVRTRSQLTRVALEQLKDQLS